MEPSQLTGHAAWTDLFERLAQEPSPVFAEVTTPERIMRGRISEQGSCSIRCIYKRIEFLDSGLGMENSYVRGVQCLFEKTKKNLDP